MPLSDEARAAVEWHFKTMDLQGKLNALEDALGSVPPQTWFNIQGNDQGFVCLMQLPKRHGPDREGRYVTGTGETRIAAIRNAVAAANEGTP